MPDNKEIDLSGFDEAMSSKELDLSGFDEVVGSSEKKKSLPKTGTSTSSASAPLIFKDVEPYTGAPKSISNQFVSETRSTESKAEFNPVEYTNKELEQTQSNISLLQKSIQDNSAQIKNYEEQIKQNIPSDVKKKLFGEYEALITETNNQVAEYNKSIDRYSKLEVRKRDLMKPSELRQQNDIDAMDAFMNAVKRGYSQGEVTNILSSGGQLTNEDIDRIAQANKYQQGLKQSKAYENFTKAESVSDALDILKNDPIEVISQLTGESMANMYRNAILVAPKAISTGMTVGAGVGAVSGSAIPIVGTTAGAAAGSIAGAGYGLMAGLSTAGFNMEVAGDIIQSFTDAGVDVTNPEQLKTAFNNKELMNDARAHAYKRAVPIALFDLVSMGLAGKILGKPAKTIAGKVGQGALEAGTQMALAGGGEAAAQLAADSKLAPVEILAESIGELGGGAPEVLVGAAVEAKKQGKSLKEYIVGVNVPQEQFNEMVDVSVGMGDITTSQANDIKKEYAEMQTVKESIPEEYRNEIDVVNAIAEKQRLQEKMDEVTQKMSGLDNAFIGEYQNEISSIQSKIDEINKTIQSKINEAKSKTVDTEVAAEPTPTPEVDIAATTETEIVEPITQTDAIQEPSTKGVFPRQQGEIRETGGEREGMGQRVEGAEIAQEGQKEIRADEKAQAEGMSFETEEEFDRYVSENSQSPKELAETYQRRLANKIDSFGALIDIIKQRGLKMPFESWKRFGEPRDVTENKKLYDKYIDENATPLDEVAQELGYTPEDIMEAIRWNELKKLEPKGNPITEKIKEKYEALTGKKLTPKTARESVAEMTDEEAKELAALEKDYEKAIATGRLSVIDGEIVSQPELKTYKRDVSKRIKTLKDKFAEFEQYFAQKVKPEEGKRKQAKAERKAFMEGKDPRTQYIMENMDNILKQLVEKGVVTTNCL